MNAFRKCLKNKHRCMRSMIMIAGCWNNGVAESLFGTLKKELVHLEKYKARPETRFGIDYIRAAKEFQSYHEFNTHTNRNFKKHQFKFGQVILRTCGHMKSAIFVSTPQSILAQSWSPTFIPAVFASSIGFRVEEETKKNRLAYRRNRTHLNANPTSIILKYARNLLDSPQLSRHAAVAFRWKFYAT